MGDIWILGGTTEGRILAERCALQKIRALISVVSEYGRQLLPEDESIIISEKPLDESGMEETIRREGIRLVLDATHPYAEEVSSNIKAACALMGIRCLRVLREDKESLSLDRGGRLSQGERVFVSSAEEAAAYLNHTEGPVLVTTGSKELAVFTAVPDYRNRLYVRVLPNSRVLAGCENMGITGKHIIAAQGPFSLEWNEAVMRQLRIRYLVTKEAGAAGGFGEKLEAAQNCGALAIVIKKPEQEEGISLKEALKILDQWTLEDSREEVPGPETASAQADAGQVFLIGIGMGSIGQMTVEAVNTIKSCQAVLGAPRMLECVRKIEGVTNTFPVYRPDEVRMWLKEHAGCRRIAFVMSGDSGFYSGAKRLRKLFEAEYASAYQVHVLPGISSVSYLCSKVPTSWEDVFIVSLHGRSCDLIKLFEEHSRIFLLLGGKYSMEEVCAQLAGNGYAESRVTAGESLSYPGERIVRGTAKELKKEKFAGLVSAFIEVVKS